MMVKGRTSSNHVGHFEWLSDQRKLYELTDNWGNMKENMSDVIVSTVPSQ